MKKPDGFKEYEKFRDKFLKFIDKEKPDYHQYTTLVTAIFMTDYITNKQMTKEQIMTFVADAYDAHTKFNGEFDES